VRDTARKRCRRTRVQRLADLWGHAQGTAAPSFAFGLSGVHRCFIADALNGMYTVPVGYMRLGLELEPFIDYRGLGHTRGDFRRGVPLSGAWDRAIGPMPVIVTCCSDPDRHGVLIISLTPGSIMGVALPKGLLLPTFAFYIAGALIGAAGGALAGLVGNM